MKHDTKPAAAVNVHTNLGVLDPCGPTGALLSALLENHPVHQLAVVDRTTKLLADLSARANTENKTRGSGFVGEVGILRSPRKIAWIFHAITPAVCPEVAPIPHSLYTLISLRSTLVALSGSMMPSTASTAIGLMVSQFWLTTLDDRHVSTAWISVSLIRRRRPTNPSTEKIYTKGQASRQPSKRWPQKEKTRAQGKKYFSVNKGGGRARSLLGERPIASKP